MDQAKLIRQCRELIKQADRRSAAGFPKQTLGRLVDLRELLNDQPELEAGGAYGLVWKLEELIEKAESLLSQAKQASIAKDTEQVDEYLGDLYDLLDDEVGSGARDKHK